MMNLLSFRDYCEKNSPTVILYDDENNTEPMSGYSQRGTISNPLKMCLTFDSVTVFFNPNTIMLKGDSGVMYIRYIMGIDIREADSVLGDTVIVYCSNGKRKTSYTLVMR